MNFAQYLFLAISVALITNVGYAIYITHQTGHKPIAIKFLTLILMGAYPFMISILPGDAILGLFMHGWGYVFVFAPNQGIATPYFLPILAYQCIAIYLWIAASIKYVRRLNKLHG